MGRRPNSQVFLPGKYVFPGGRLEPGDTRIVRAAFNCGLAAGTPQPPQWQSRLHAFAATAIRETFEETGLIVGAQMPTPRLTRSPGWRRFFAEGYLPATGRLRLFARAVTPPGRPRRYDTRFFWTCRSEISGRIAAADGELLELDWVTIPEARRLPVANITQRILDEAESLLAAHQLAAPNAPGQTIAATPDSPVPLFRQRGNSFERVLLSQNEAAS